MHAGFDCTIHIEPSPAVPACRMRHLRTIGAEELGITADFQLTPKLYVLMAWLIFRETLFILNRAAVDKGRKEWLTKISAYRARLRTQALCRHQTLSYSFQINIYTRPAMRYVDLTVALARDDSNPDVTDIPEYARSGMIYLFERMLVVNQSKIHKWW